MLHAQGHAHWQACDPKRPCQLQLSAFGDRRPCASRIRPTRVFKTISRAAATHAFGEGPFGSQAVLDRYQALLHEYRQHKASLGDWFGAFLSRQRRPPQLLDAEATGDAELVARFQQYLMVRKRLLAEIPLLRDQLDEAGATGSHQHHTSSSNSTSSGGSKHRHSHKHHHSAVNANQAAPISKAQAVGQFFAAVNYRQQHSPRRTAAATADSSSGSSADTSTTMAAADAQLQVAEVLQRPAAADAAATVASVVGSSVGQDLDSLAGGSSSSSSRKGSKENSAAHLLTAASSQASGSSGGSRATSAALAALAYKKQKQQPAAAGSSSGSAAATGRQARGLAMLQAETPQLPPGIDAAAAAAGRVVIGVVETAKGDVNAGRRNSRPLDADVSLEATLQGVPGGLGSSSGSAMFAAAIAVPSAGGTADAAGVASSSSSSGVLAKPPGADASAPVGQVVTARFDVYAGRNRQLPADAALDEYFAGLEAAAAAATAAATAHGGGPSDAGASSSSDGGSPKKSDTTGGSSSRGQQQQQQQAKHTQQPGYGGLLPDIVPFPI